MIDSKASQLSDVDLIVGAALEAGKIALGFFRQSPEVWWKNNGQSPVSAADFAANESLAAALRTARPDYGWLSEETDDDAERLKHATVFVVDPIDGTRGFLSGLDLWCVSVAVVTDGRPVAGVLYAPALGELFVATAGGQALKNGEPISVSQRVGDDINRLATGEEMLKGFDPDFRKTVERVKHVPSLAYRLAMVADGRLEGTIVKRNSHDWDLAAADLILERAGGALVDLSGKALRYNRAEVSHDELCGASAAQLPEFLRQLSNRRDG
ncbi:MULTISPECIES: 3'(2'),5'-bisphosphate nucleotidase CysQ [Rhizobium]|uniref:3'(2'),5'-bisphosphate nucleotidase CysQ n=1 Tax=Rhizobium tropici TaxID=398 RepID=A0A6P1C357_RHITR|nr:MULTISPECIES: 3'(2'),5'-bisphosphate nucleotidase CysQ [Rhizobium]AGB70221.1 inositol monophosphatase family protein [Rhizobium tropici CIAT 899]MBB4239382.1 myo-inositol-1(or 4)-monophosphatase [Rhizobium tropici]MBB5590652.1 myo-inositol-1(or 4)-monophosphatase [Rhizobium tropici]MBB6490139.1 myo-inositol-1(or 4)-monophosphatase [Rhizobium tropici]NEV09374.1 3'(2'),5'-bisphosphate nucleotidase CysQ [Rhizobium tropici]